MTSVNSSHISYDICIISDIIEMAVRVVCPLLFYLSEYAERIFVKIKNNPPSAKEQTTMMLNAFKSYMSKETYMTVEEVDSKYVRITGDLSGPASKITVSNFVGRAGEVAVHDSIMSFLSQPKMKERYSTYIIEGTALVLIPADFNLVSQTRNALTQHLTPMGAKMIEKAQEEWKMLNAGSSVSDFLMKNAYPIESKAKINTYVFLSGGKSETYKPSGLGVKAINPYIKKITSEGGKVILGASFFDVIMKDIGKKILEPIETSLVEMAASLSKEQGRAIMADVQLPKGQGAGKGRLFKLIGVRLSMFVPIAVDSRNVEQFLEKRIIHKSDRKAVLATTKFTLSMIAQLIANESIR